MGSFQAGFIPALDSRLSPVNANPSSVPAATGEFKKLLQSTQSDLSSQAANQSSNVTISGHARERLRMRNINLNNDDMSKISNAMDRVAEKGGRQALLMVKTSGGQDAGLVVSVRNRVVITAVDSASLRDNIFTNIDSAAIVP